MFYWGYRESRRVVKSVVNVCGSTVQLQLLLAFLAKVEVGAIRGAAENLVEIKKTSDCEGSLLDCN